MEASDARAAEVLAFWFPASGRDARWFGKDPAFDAEIHARFAGLYSRANGGELAHWSAAAADCLALIVVLDQFPRNMFRGTARAFASDADALEVARLAVARGYDRAMTPAQRLFAYLPFEHSEALADQERACALVEPLAAHAETGDAYRYALAHRDIVRRFGRFPHRNAALGRASTPEELEFLKGPGSSF